MKPLLLNCLFTAAVFAATLALADDAELVNGKWSAKKVSEQGQNYTQNIEVKKDKFTFEILGADGQVVVHAEGDLKLDKLGPFNSARFFHIRAGESSANLNDVSEEFTSIYTLDSDTWIMASNFDKERSQKPGSDVYHRVNAAAPPGALVIDEIQMADTPQAATWFVCFEATMDGVVKRHYIANKGYDKSKVTIPTTIEFPKARACQKCTFRMQLDDIDEDACTEEVDNRSSGEFTVSEKGSQTYKPESNWSYTIRWHLK